MNTIEFVRLLAASLAVGLIVSMIAYAISVPMERAEEEDAELLRIQLGADPIRVHGMPTEDPPAREWPNHRWSTTSSPSARLTHDCRDGL